MQSNFTDKFSYNDIPNLNVVLWGPDFKNFLKDKGNEMIIILIFTNTVNCSFISVYTVDMLKSTFAKTHLKHKRFIQISHLLFRFLPVNKSS